MNKISNPLENNKRRPVVKAALGFVFGAGLGLIVGDMVGGLALGLIFGAIGGLIIGSALDRKHIY